MLTTSISHTKCPTANTLQYIKFSTTLPAGPPHTPTQNVQLPTHNNTYNSVQHFLLTPSQSDKYCPTAKSLQYIQFSTPQYAVSLHTPTQNFQIPKHSSTYNSVRYFHLKLLHSHTKCPTTNTQQYIQFSTPHPADPLTLPHKMSNYQHTALHTIQYATSS